MTTKHILALRKKQKNKGWSTTATILLIVSVFSIAVVLLGTFLYLEMRDQERIKAAIEKELGALKSAGYPMSAGDMAKLFPDPPADRDANLLLKPALALLSVPKEATNLPFFGMSELSGNAPLEKSVIAEGREWMERNQPALKAVPWDKLEGAWIGCSFTNGLTNLSLPRLMPMIGLARLLCLDAVLEAEEQQPEKSIQALQRILILSRTLKNDVPFHYRLREALEDRVCVALERVMNRTTVPDDLLRSLADRLTVTNAGSATWDMAVHSLPQGLYFADILKSQSSQLTKGVVSPIRLIARTVGSRFIYRDRDFLHYLNWNNRCLAALKLPVKEALPALLTIEKEKDDALKARPVSFLNSWRKERTSFLSMQEFGPTQFLVDELTTVAKVRETLAAIAIQRWRATHGGEAPNSLAEIASDLPTWALQDPFTGQLLRYKKLPHGYAFKCTWPDEANKKLLPNYRKDEHRDKTFQIGPDSYPSDL